jgi:hypothetical protein
MGEQSPAFPADEAGNTPARFLFTKAVDTISPAESARRRHGDGGYSCSNADTDDCRRVTTIKDDKKQKVTDESGSSHQQITTLYAFES